MERSVLRPADQTPPLTEPRVKREDIIRELRRQASTLREEGQTAADFWLAEQYETTADLLN